MRGDLLRHDAPVTEKADWTKPGIVFFGGSRDGEVHDLTPADGSMNLANDIEGEETIEMYERTEEAKDGRTVFRYTGRRQDLEGEGPDDADDLWGRA